MNDADPMEQLRLRPRRASSASKEAPCKRQQKWRDMACQDFDQLDKIACSVVEKVERCLLIFLKTDNPRVAKACFKTIKRNYPMLRDMVHAGVMDDSVNTLIKALDSLFYPGRS